MARKQELVDETLRKQAEEALGQIRDGKICQRLQAIISCYSHSPRLVAEVIGRDRSMVWRWVKRFRAEGVEGLRDRPRGHNPAKLGKRERAQIRRWLEGGKNRRGEPVHWTLEKLRAEIAVVFGREVGQTPLWNLVRQLGFRQKVPRPAHEQSDPRAQAAFKKNG